MPPVEAFVALGSNLGERAETLQQATDCLHEAAGITVLAASPVYETVAHTQPPHVPQPAYLNAVLRVATTRAPWALLRLLLQCEHALGRHRSTPWAPRTLDLDLLLYGERVVSLDALQVPHPRLHLRRFVLRPLADLAPDLRLPFPYFETVRSVLAGCPDPDVPTSTDFTLTF